MSFWNVFRKQTFGAQSRKYEDSSANSSLRPLHRELIMNLQQLKAATGNSADLVIREFQIGSPQVAAAAIYIDNLADKKMVGDFIMRSLMMETAQEGFMEMVSDKNVFDIVKDHALTIGEVEILKDWNKIHLAVLSGDTVILIDGWNEAISGSTRGGGQWRSVSEPTTQVVIRGPKDSFTESIATNVSLVRRRIKSPSLWLEHLRIGEVSQTDVCMMYIKGIANDKLVEELRKRLQDIEIDAILESGYIEELIQDQSSSPFPTILNTERPDAVAGNLLEGRIAVFVDGTPFVLIAPTTFFMYFQSPEDYYHRYDVATMIRFLRYLSFLISLLGPSIYVAAITFHQEMIPTPLLISLAAQRETVPFPAFFEALMMEIAFEILREAGVRMPRAIGQAVSIVGALVLGQAAVQAGIVSSAMVIVVALTGIASFSTPSYSMALSVRLLRFIIMIFAATYGFYGIALSNIVIIAHMCGLRSFGVPYMTPFAPFVPQDQKDVLFRVPWWALITRPRFMSQKKPTRMKQNMKPAPPEENGE